MRKLLLLIAVVALSMSAGATTVYVNGNKITGTTSFSTGGGTVSYDSDSKTLTVNGVSFSRTGSDNNAIDNHDVDGLIVTLKGTNTMTIANADVINCRAKTTINVTGTTTLKCTADDQNCIKARGADVTVKGSGTLYLESTAGAVIEGKNGTEKVSMAIRNCEITAGRQAFYNIAQMTISPSTSPTTVCGVAIGTTIVLKAHDNTTYTHAKNITKWLNHADVTIKNPEYALDFTKLTQAYYANKEIVITGETVADNYFTVGSFLYSLKTLDGQTCAELAGPTVANKYKSPTTLNVPGFVTYNNSTYPVTVGEGAFSVNNLPKWSTVKTVRLSFGVKSIGRLAFQKCVNLDSLFIPSSVTKFKDNIFPGAGKNAGTMHIYWATLSPLTGVSTYTFSTHAATAAYVYFPTPAALTAANKAPITTYLTLGDVDPYRCSDCNNNGNYYVVTAGNTSSAPGELALVGTKNRNIDINTTAGSASINYKTYYCTSIAATAFSNNASIGEVRLTSTRMKSIGEKAFAGSSISKIRSGSSVTSIGDEALNACSSLLSAEVAAGTIGTSAFANCGKLSSVTIGGDVSGINDNAFNGCNALSTIDVAIEQPQTLTYGSNIFDGVDKQTCVLNIPGGTLDAYKATMPWSEFFNIIDPDPAFARGDVNGDGSVNSGDVSAVYNVMLGLTTDADILARADVNGDGSVNSGDVSVIYEIMTKQ